MITLLQISDPHFGTEQTLVVEALASLVKSQQPEFAIWSGDITQRARHTQFASAKAFSDRLAIPHLLAVPGNHDIPLFNFIARIFYPYSGYKRAFGNNLEPIFESEELLIICLNTTRPWRHKNGELSQKQIDHVAQKVKKANPSQLRIVVTHQPISIESEKDEENLLIGYDHALKSWSNAGVDMVLGGHIHRPHAHKMANHFGPIAGNMWSIQAGTAVSYRIRDGIPNSVNLIRYSIENQKRSCIVERWNFDNTTQQFQVNNKDNIELTDYS